MKAISIISATALAAGTLLGQSSGSLSGRVALQQTGDPLHGANVLIVELDLNTFSDDNGNYSFDDVPAGSYRVVSHLDHLFTEAAKEVTIAPGDSASLDFALSVTAEKYEITVTASDKEETPFESFQDVDSLDASDLNELTSSSLGEALDQRVGEGVAKRSFGPGSSRPIIRGFDGDRVLIMEDGIRTGTLSSQSADHGEVINTAQLERLEIVKGPATLLYSGNAMGGTVNAVSRHHEHHRHPHEGLRGFVSGSGGSTNSLGGGSAGFEYGAGRWMIWGQGGGVRSGDYTAPIQGEIFNSRSRVSNGGGGLGWYGDRQFFSVDAKVDRGQYGVPFAADLHGHEEEEGEHAEEEEEEGHGEEEEIERISLDTRRTSFRVNWGLNNLGPAIEGFTLKLSYIDWEHDEVEFFEDGQQEIGTAFTNDQFVYRGVFEQRRAGPLSGRFGFWGVDRGYDVSGEEALSPPIDQNGVAFFALEELTFESFKLQFGGRIERQAYDPAFSVRESDHADEAVPDAIERTFTGGSAAAGIHTDLWKGGAFVANYAHSYRAPALEELYNFGPHVGNLAFEVGDPGLDAELGNGVDLSLRHKEGRVRGELNLFYYDFSSFIFPFATGEIEDELQVIEFTQRDARFTGAEANLNLGVAQDVWLNLGLDFVDAQDTDFNTPLPRIPPLRGRVGLDYRRGGLRFAPELVLASQQHQTFTGETRTPGYVVANLKASYTYARQHAAHQFSVNVFNVGDRLYRNHSSLIKDLAPEIGRGVKVSYMVRFF